jgi:hypothetical protein
MQYSPPLEVCERQTGHGESTVGGGGAATGCVSMHVQSGAKSAAQEVAGDVPRELEPSVTQRGEQALPEPVPPRFVGDVAQGVIDAAPMGTMADLARMGHIALLPRHRGVPCGVRAPA